MTSLYTRHGRRFSPASATEVAREVLRRSDWRGEVLRVLSDHPDRMCLDCGGEEMGGHPVQLDGGGWTWRTCAQCRAGRVLESIAAAALPADS